MTLVLPPVDQLFDALPDAVLCVRDGDVVRANAAAGRLLGEVTGRPIHALLTEAARRRLDRLPAPGESDEPEALRLAFLRDAGGPLTVEVRAAHAPDGSLLLCLRDGTESARAEDLVVRLGRLSATGQGGLELDRLLDAAEPIFVALGWRAALMEVKPEGVRLARVLSRHRPDHPAERYLDAVRASDGLGWASLPVTRRVLAQGEAVFLDDVREIAGTGDAEADAFVESMVASGYRRAIWSPIRTDDTWTHLLVVVGPDLNEHDFVAVQLFAAQLAATARLARLGAALVRRERLAAVGEMAAVLAHEVRNPLGVIFNVAVGLRRQMADRPEALELLGILNQEADRLKRIVADLLDFARPVSPEFRPVAVAAILDEALERVRADETCEARHPRFETTTGEDVPEVRTDPVLLRRALENVLLNACQHVPAGGRVAIEVRAEDGGVHVGIFNEGPPIPEEVAARIFEPFFTTKATGTGLGLAVVRRTMEDLGGRIAHEPTGDGVRFGLWMPEARGEANG